MAYSSAGSVFLVGMAISQAFVDTAPSAPVAGRLAPELPYVAAQRGAVMPRFEGPFAPLALPRRWKNRCPASSR